MSNADQQSRFIETYKTEANELLDNLETLVLDLEDDKTDADILSAIFRAFHTIKGNSAMFGFESIASFTHHFEHLLDMVRDGKVEITDSLITHTLRARDFIRELLDRDDIDSEADKATGTAMITAIQDEMGINLLGDDTETAEPVAKAETAESKKIFRISFTPSNAILANGTKPLKILEELSELGVYNCLTIFDDLPSLEDLDPESCYLRWQILLTTEVDENEIKDVFIFLDNDSKIEIKVLDQSEFEDEEGEVRLGEILKQKALVGTTDISAALSKQRRIGEILVEQNLVSPHDVKTALVEQQHIKKNQDQKKSQSQATTMRVSSTKLDQLMDLVGELVTVNAGVTQMVQQTNKGELGTLAEMLDRITSELRDNVMNIRLLPIGTTFSRFKRLVRDLSNDLGKEIELVTEGGETEMDKKVIEKLNDPLIHIIRNSIDHGLEDPDERKAQGKPAKGRVRLKAHHSGASVVISIEDDGKGIDKDKLLAKAKKAGIVPSGVDLSDEQIFELMFSPGLSTATTVTNISGRGVGMDVVRKEIEALRGRITIQSKKGVGTTISLYLPLTLAIIDGLIVQVGGDKFILPLGAVEVCIESTKAERAKELNRNMIPYRDTVIPYISLRELYGFEGDIPEFEKIVILNVKDDMVGLLVDDVIEDSQVVIKSLGSMYSGAESFSGATILGDGSVVLTIDPNKVIDIYNSITSQA